jgi:hypothetical protein
VNWTEQPDHSLVFAVLAQVFQLFFSLVTYDGLYRDNSLQRPRVAHSECVSPPPIVTQEVYFSIEKFEVKTKGILKGGSPLMEFEAKPQGALNKLLIF